jgi:hypothetical protein
MIYPNLQEARKALDSLVLEYYAMMERYGASFEIDDSCIESWFIVEYLDESGGKRRLYS